MSLTLEALADRVRSLEDREAVRSVVIAIAAGVDRHDVALLRASIWPEAHIDMGGPQPTTGEAFAAALTPPAKPARGRMHLTGNHRVRVDGDGAEAESHVISCQEVQGAEGDETRVRAGRYLDRFERREGVWKLSRRVFVDEWSRLDPVARQPAVGARRSAPAPHDPVYAELTLDDAK
jgi:SnoaL-like domain